MKVDSNSFPKTICTQEFKSIRGRGDHHHLLLFWNLNVAHADPTLFPSYPSFLSNKREHMKDRRRRPEGGEREPIKIP
jgi:hypothetical protein